MKIRLDRLFLIKSLGVVISHSIYRIGEVPQPMPS